MFKNLNEMTLIGVGGSPGICIGRAYLVEQDGTGVIRKYHLLNDYDIEHEINRFKQAVASAEQQMTEIMNSASKELREHLIILETHKVLLKDKMLYGKTIEIINKEHVNAEWSLKKALHYVKDIFNQMNDPYLRERSSDIIHVSNRIMRNLIGAESTHLGLIQKRVILVAHDLSPAETCQIQLERVQGFITNMGGKTSHTSIIARTLEVPAVLGVGNASDIIKNDDMLILDGNTGKVIVHPTDETLSQYEQLKNKLEKYKTVISKNCQLPGKTIDGIEKKVMANIELLEEVVSVNDHGGDGIGLYRTEFLYMKNKTFPTEEQLYENYKEIAELISPRPITIRTLDINGDKAIQNSEMPGEANPVLGLRAIRYCLKRQDVFKTQLRAILRAAVCGNVKIMFPMIACMEELKMAKQLFYESANELQKQGISHNRNIEIGIMMEVPSAIIIADKLAEEADFFSIGTNDLIQYTLAIDRGNKDVAHLFQPLHPAIIRMIQFVSNASKSKGIKTYMCGEMASDPHNIPILMALGIDEFSMNPPSIPIIKNAIRKISTEGINDFLSQALALNTAEDVMNLIKTRFSSVFQDEPTIL